MAFHHLQFTTRYHIYNKKYYGLHISALPLMPSLCCLMALYHIPELTRCNSVFHRLVLVGHCLGSGEDLEDRPSLWYILKDICIVGWRLEDGEWICNGEYIQCMHQNTTPRFPSQPLRKNAKPKSSHLPERVLHEKKIACELQSAQYEAYRTLT